MRVPVPSPDLLASSLESLVPLQLLDIPAVQNGDVPSYLEQKATFRASRQVLSLYGVLFFVHIPRCGAV